MEVVCPESRICVNFEKKRFLIDTGAFLLAIFVFILLFAVCPPNVHAGQATLAWDANTSGGVTGYRLYYGTSSGNYSQSIDVGKATSYTVGNLTDGKTYYFSAKAYDAAGNLSAYSNEASKTITPTAPVTQSLTVNISGTGGGAVTSIPSGFSCSGATCTDNLNTGATVTLMATPNSDSTFAGWSGACTNKTGDCVVTANAGISVTANFDTVAFARIDGTSPKYFSLLGSACNAASSGNVVQAMCHEFNEDLVLDNNAAISIEGGYDSEFSANAGYSTLHGSLTIGTGVLTAENLIID